MFVVVEPHGDGHMGSAPVAPVAGKGLGNPAQIGEGAAEKLARVALAQASRPRFFDRLV